MLRLMALGSVEIAVPCHSDESDITLLDVYTEASMWAFFSWIVNHCPQGESLIDGVVLYCRLLVSYI
jgi:hypothetical protein